MIRGAASNYCVVDFVIQASTYDHIDHMLKTSDFVVDCQYAVDYRAGSPVKYITFNYELCPKYPVCTWRALVSSCWSKSSMLVPLGTRQTASAARKWLWEPFSVHSAPSRCSLHKKDTIGNVVAAVTLKETRPSQWAATWRPFWHQGQHTCWHVVHGSFVWHLVFVNMVWPRMGIMWVGSTLQKPTKCKSMCTMICMPQEANVMMRHE